VGGYKTGGKFLVIQRLSVSCDGPCVVFERSRAQISTWSPLRELRFFVASAVPPENSNLNLAATDSFHIFSNLSFMYHHLIRRKRPKLLKKRR
jgi:hypothetical protein